MRNASLRHRASAKTICLLSAPILLATTLAWSPVGSAYGQAPTQDLADANLSDPDRQRETLDWLDTYMTGSDLMSRDDVAKIRAAVVQMSPSQLERWLKQTRDLRAYVESPQWQDTKKWLNGFLKVQAIYSDKEIQEFRQQLFDADPEQMLAMLQRIQAKHESMVWMHQAAGKSRETDLQARNAMVARQDAANNAARTAAATQSALFGNVGNFARSSKPDSGYSIPGALINSRTMAQWTVFQGMW
jgi:hypothetical protein